MKKLTQEKEKMMKKKKIRLKISVDSSWPQFTRVFLLKDDIEITW